MLGLELLAEIPLGQSLFVDTGAVPIDNSIDSRGPTERLKSRTLALSSELRPYDRRESGKTRQRPRPLDRGPAVNFIVIDFIGCVCASLEVPSVLRSLEAICTQRHSSQTGQ